MPLRPDDRSETRAAFPVPAAGPQTFQAEQLVADRFRIVRFVAGGGMGEVYEAEDLELHENVALKTIRRRSRRTSGPSPASSAKVPGPAGDAPQHLPHPRPLRAPPADRGRRGRADDHVRDDGAAERARRWPSGCARRRCIASEALPLIEQMAAALDAAHQVGVVHRDFKSNNVMLLPPARRAPRAVVTDFGIARAGERRGRRATSPTLTGRDPRHAGLHGARADRAARSRRPPTSTRSAW